jgi:signal peptide peptidase SppA
MKTSYVLQAFLETPWAILPSKLAMLEEIVARHVRGEELKADEVQTLIHGARRPQDGRAQNNQGGKTRSVAILPLFGTIFPRANLMTSLSGATSSEEFGAQFSALVNDPDISAIILSVDSPGGQVSGVEELSKKIFDARGKKPIVAVVNHTMASAAYWIGTAADQVIVSPTAEVGSIGVFAVHKDYSAALEKEGIKVSLISRGKYKVEANPYEPLTEEARASIDASVDEYYNLFIDAISRNRAVSLETVKNTFGEGRMVSANRAVTLGMADKVATLEETINELLSIPALTSGSQNNSQLENVNVAETNSESSTEAESAGETEREAQRLRDYLDVYA